MLSFVLLAFLLALPASEQSAAPPRKTIAAVPAGGPITVDGLLEEPPWKTPGRDEFTQSDPWDGRPPTERTTVWVAYDKDNLYVAARLLDSRPDLVVGRLGRRDEFVDSDWFFFGLDPYYDRRSGFYFAVNPSGSILDGTLSNDETKDPTWDGIWESAARVDDRGWAVEIRVPFGQLRFKSKGEYIWGVNFQRDIKRKNETDYFSWKPKEESGFVSRFADLVGVRGIDPGRRLELWPYAASRAAFSPAVAGDPFRTGSEASAATGLDLKARLRSNLILDASVNPDFGQVEVDPAVINITDQETYFQEKRPFFIEGSSIFAFGRGGPNVYKSYGWTDPSFFYTRRVGRPPQGRVVGPGYADVPDWTTILAAAKVTGKVGQGFNLGLLSALTGREHAKVDLAGVRSETEVEPLTSYGVVRGLKEWGEGRSGLGFVATSVLRDLRGGALESILAGRSFGLAADGWTFLDKDKAWVLTGWAGGTLVQGSRAFITRLQKSSLHYFQRPDVDYVRVDANATSLSGWAGRLYLNKQKGNIVFNAALGAISPGFEANDLGYHTRGDVWNGHVQFGYQTFHPGRVFRRWEVAAMYYLNYDFGGNRTGEYWYLDGEGQFLNYWTTTLHLDYEPPKYSHYLTRGGPMAFYPSGSTVRWGATSDSRKALVLRFNAYYRYHPSGGYTWSLGGGLTWKPSSNFSLSVSPSYTWRYSEGQWITQVPDPLKTATYGVRYILSDIVQKTLPVELRLNWTFTPRLSLQAYLQPYIGTGDYSLFKELRAAKTFDFDVFGAGESTLAFAGGRYTADSDGPAGPAAPFSFPDPDFSLKSLRGTVVFRWEYRPGSMLYLVWTQRRADTSHPGDFEFGRDMVDLFRAPGDNIFLLKFSYRFEL
ncbi:MAG: carbohydrate binding family 9 domain-containing protein [Candidatus Aminicenantes bacterium]|nr:carbohydrate binding family 9 domain-containing protein [Candidatus Aminicenantes bacterium]